MLSVGAVYFQFMFVCDLSMSAINIGLDGWGNRKNLKNSNVGANTMNPFLNQHIIMYVVKNVNAEI